MSKTKPITFDPSNAFVSPHGITQNQFDGVKDKIDACRREMVEVDLGLWADGKNIPPEKQPLDAGFHELPERMLDVYQSDRESSQLGRILKSAARLRELVDKVVVLGSGGSYMGAQALMKTCCAPYHNEMTRGQRGGRPRMYFEGNSLDNDRTQALLQLLESDSRGDGLDSPQSNWGMIVISQSDETLETAAFVQIFTNALKAKVGEDRLKDFIVPITPMSGKPSDLATEIGCVDRFVVPDGVGERFSVLSAVGLLPAAVLGIDVVKLLEAAAAMNSHFQTAEFGNNAVMDYAAVNHLLEINQGVNIRVFIRVLSVWSKSLESVGFWYDQLLAESLGRHKNGPFSLTCVDTRDLHSQTQHQQCVFSKVINNVIVGSWRQEHLAIGESKYDQDGLNELSDTTLPQIMDAVIGGTNLAYKEDGRPTTNINLPAADEGALGQLFQMLMLATTLEGRLLGMNPYGPPGVKKHKNYSDQLLRKNTKTAAAVGGG